MAALKIIDLFCGAGGTSTGILKACDERLRRPVQLTAVNHWPTAINSHSLNHPRVQHICESVENLHPMDLVKGGRLDLLAASCECRYHSNARGGGPCNEQSRSQAWQLIRWATDIRVDDILMENVREFLNWGPLLTKSIRYQGKTYKKERPDPRRKGEFFRAFIAALANLDRSVDYRLQVAADFGDPTSRQRLILISRRNRRPITWPSPTHGPGRRHPWRAARECIDLTSMGKSLFGPDGKPRLCQNTVERIAAGIEKFGGENGKHFLALLKGTSRSHLASCAKSIDEPAPSIQAGGRHLMLCQPFVYHITHRGSHRSRCHSLDEPLPTITTANRGEMALVQLIAKYYKTGRCKPLDLPIDAITTKARFLLIQCAETTLGLDILTRMLTDRELAACHSFPSAYRFTGDLADRICQIGNSVPVELAAAHAAAVLS